MSMDNKKVVLFNKPQSVAYLEDLSFNDNIGVRFSNNGLKAMVIAKNENQFYLVGDNIALDMQDVFNDLKDVCTEQDEISVFETFEDLCKWMGNN